LDIPALPPSPRAASEPYRFTFSKTVSTTFHSADFFFDTENQFNASMIFKSSQQIISSSQCSKILSAQVDESNERKSLGDAIKDQDVRLSKHTAESWRWREEFAL
jgi:hypothetical protein